ncbi:MAG: hypothetical protein AABX55_02425 [Nanoarchaeota archaeon]
MAKDNFDKFLDESKKLVLLNKAIYNKAVTDARKEEIMESLRGQINYLINKYFSEK